MQGKEKLKQITKALIPVGLWTGIRRSRIVRDQARVANLCDTYIKNYFDSGEKLFVVKPKMDLSGKKIIWQYWAQGFDGKLPEVVRYCLESVDRYKGDYEVIRLSDETISQYVDIPEYIWAKRGNGFSVTAFSNVLRLALLDTYGGLWLDSTVLLTGEIPDYLAGNDYFMFQRDENEVNKKYWEGTYAYYFGWGDDFRVRVLTSIVYSKVGSRFIDDYLNLLLYVWKVNEHYPFYFTFQVLYNQLAVSGLSAPVCNVVNDCPPHSLMQIINDPDAPFTISDTLNKCSMHKLTYKELCVERFRTVVNDIK